MSAPTPRTAPERRPRFAAEVGEGLRRSVRGRRLLVLVSTLLVGALVAGAVVRFAPVDSIAEVAAPAQLVMSVLVPLTGVLLAHDLTTGAWRGRPAAAITAAVLYAVAVGLVGFVLVVAAVAFMPGTPWGPAGTAVGVVLGGVVAQATAQLVGTGCGLHLRSTWVAFAATIVPPLGLWLLVGALGPLAILQQFLTPFGAIPPLLSGEPTAFDVTAWVVALALWGGGLNGAGIARLRRRAAARRR